MAVEQRIDPDDEQLYTLEALKDKYAGDFTTSEIEEYWREECTVPPSGVQSPERVSTTKKACTEEPLQAPVLATRGGGAKREEVPDPSEKRFDPEDGLSYHFEDFVTKCTGSFEEAEVLRYWFEEMTVDPPDGTKLVVSGLSQATTAEALGERFAAYGELALCELHCDAAQASRGIATLQYTSTQAASKALASMNGAELDGVKITVRELRDRDRDLSIFVGAVAEDITAEDLEEAFGTCGEVRRCTILREKRVEARIDFIFPESVQRAVATFHLKAPIRGQKVVVAPWQEDDGGRRLPGPSVFIAKLPLDTSERQLQELFEGAGLVVLATQVFRKKDTHESRGIAKVELGDEASVKRAVEKLQGVELDGSALVVREFSSQAKQQVERQRAVFVSGLCTETTYEGLSTFFARAGELESTQLFVDRELARPICVARLVFKDLDGFRQALRLNGSELDGKKLFVREYLPIHQAETARLPRASRIGGGFLVYVKNLGAKTTADMVREHFQRCGQVLEAVLMKNRETGGLSGTAKVAFATDEERQRAIRELYGTDLDGRPLVLREWDTQVQQQGDRRRGDDFNGGSQWARGGGDGGAQQDKGPGVFITNLSMETTEEALTACFSRFGRVTEAVVLRFRETRVSRGIGRVFFADEEDRKRAMAQANVELDGSVLTIRSHQPAIGSRPPAGFPVFLGGIPRSATAEAIRGLFETEVGEVLSVHFFLDQDGRPRGSGKLEFATWGAQQEAISRYSFVFEGRPIYTREFTRAPKTGVESLSVQVSGLSPETTVDSLFGLLRQCGDIRDCRITSATGTARVEFGSDEARRRALRDLQDAELDGSIISLREAQLPVPERESQAEASRSSRTQLAGVHSIHIAGLSTETSECMLKEHLGTCGEVVQVHFLPRNEFFSDRRAAVASFGTKAEQEFAIKELNGSVLDARTLSVRIFVRAERRAIMLSGLPADVNPDTLLVHVQRIVGSSTSIRNIKVMGESAKVEFTSQDAVRRAVEALSDAEFQGRLVSVRAVGTDGDKVGEDAEPVRGFGSRDQAEPTSSVARRAVYVGGLHPDTSDEVVRRHFEDCGEISVVRLLTDRSNGKSKGAAFVEFSTEDGQRAAIMERDRTLLNGSVVFVREFEPRQSTPSASSRAPPQTPPRSREAESSFEASPYRTPPADAEWTPSSAPHAGGAASSSSRASPARTDAEPERRVDPDDGKAYTFEELRRRAKGEGHSDQEILDYWRFDCELAHPARAAETSPPRRKEGGTASSPGPPASASRSGAGGAAAGVAAAASAAPAGVEPERKVDPDDGKAYTFAELRSWAREQGYTDQETSDYWRDVCRPLEQPPAAPAQASSAQPRPLSLVRPPAGVGTETEAPHFVETPRRAAGAPPAAGEAAASPGEPRLQAVGASGVGCLEDMSLRDWVDAVDSQWLRLLPTDNRPTNGVRDFLSTLEEQFESVDQIMKLYLRRGGGPDGTNVLDNGFFQDVGISKIGQRRVVNKWIAAHT